MIIRHSTEKDIPEILEIYKNARSYMRENGNLEQWNSIYPGESDVRADIESGNGYVCDDGGEVVAVFFFRVGDDMTYKTIYDGKWQNEDKYAVIHRVAVKHHGRGIIDFCFSECFKLFPNLKIDTHRDNLPMQHVLKRNGFKYCGIIHLLSGDERMAYQKIM